MRHENYCVPNKLRFINGINIFFSYPLTHHDDQHINMKACQGNVNKILYYCHPLNNRLIIIIENTCNDDYCELCEDFFSSMLTKN